MLQSVFRVCRNCCLQSWSFRSSYIPYRSFRDYHTDKIKSILSKMSQHKKTQTKVRDKKDKGKKYSADTISLQVLGSGAPGIPASLYVFTGRTSYLFNCGESCQRIAQANKMKLNTIENVFFTHKSWRNVGGLPGMLLTMQDMHDNLHEVKLHGPPGIHSLYTDTKKFMNFYMLGLSYNQYNSNDGLFGEDQDPLFIKSVPIPPAGSDHAATNVPEELEYVILKDSVENTENRGSKRSSLIEENGVDKKKLRTDEFFTDMAMAYICRTDTKKGKLNLELCVNAGVPPGPLLGQLKNGNDVTLPNGNIVKASDVTAPDDPSAVFIVVEAPTIPHMKTLVQHPSFSSHQCEGENAAQVVVHFTPMDIMRDSLYQDWCEKFPASTTHIILNEDNSCTGSEAVHRMQHMLHYLQPKVFPRLADESIPQLPPVTSDKNELCVEVSSLLPNCTNAVKGKSLLTYRLRPNYKLTSSQCVTIDTDSIDAEIAQSGCDRHLVFPPDLSALPEYPVITFLGTGSCLPNKTRNTSGILVQVLQDSYVILDCGEGTYGQLVRLLGKEKAYEILSQLSGIYVSHYHADHHLGLIYLLQHRREALLTRNLPVTPLPVLAPVDLLSYLTSYDRVFEPIEDLYSLINNRSLYAKSEMRASGDCQKLFDQMKIKDITTCRVNHCFDATGVALTLANGKKIVYSGDTRPCSNLVELGLECDVLIHEATFEDGLQEDALSKKHSTVTEALDIAQQMNAAHTILTHFSQRYSKLPILPSEGNALKNVCIAFDNMRVQLSDLPHVAGLYDDMSKLFAESLELSKSKYEKKLVAKERQKVVEQDLAKLGKKSLV